MDRYREGGGGSFVATPDKIAIAFAADIENLEVTPI
jgi:hypothetical protein